MRHKPTLFTGGYAPEGAVKWVEEVEIIFEAMGCSEANKLTLGTYVLRGVLEEVHFPKDVKNRKVIEFMELKQGNMFVADYSVKFEGLCAFSPHYNTMEAERD
ncbi:cellular nucleic acid-binding protein, partial [Trifolium medium]|nr:cellular nucleic acid-binding protein [Trifolium medium]